MNAAHDEARKSAGLRHALWLGVRKVVIGTLRRFNPGDISIRHHYTGEKLTLHSFKHKGYWYYGKRRESESMATQPRLECAIELALSSTGNHRRASSDTKLPWGPTMTQRFALLGSSKPPP